jgi:hypothetical protein
MRNNFRSRACDVAKNVMGSLNPSADAPDWATSDLVLPPSHCGVPLDTWDASATPISLTPPLRFESQFQIGSGSL